MDETHWRRHRYAQRKRPTLPCISRLHPHTRICSPYSLQKSPHRNTSNYQTINKYPKSKKTQTMKLLLLLSLAVVSFLTSCGSSVTSTSSLSSHEKFVKREDYKKTYDTYTNDEALKAIDKSKVKLNVNIATQRLIASQDGTVLLDTPCTTGRAGKRTPTGTFKLYDKQADKRSNVYGTLYKNGKRVCGGHRYDKCKGVSYDKYVGSSLPYWQRLTGDGIGLHLSGSVKRYPASGGCIRLMPAYAKKLFGMTKVGTPITVTSS